MESFKLYEVIKYVSMTNHMWSGFNQLAHLATWQPRARRHQGRHRTQRDEARAAAAAGSAGREHEPCAPTLVDARLVFNDVDAAPFRRQLSGFYATWKKQLGARCWSLLESAAGSSLA